MDKTTCNQNDTKRILVYLLLVNHQIKIIAENEYPFIVLDLRYTVAILYIVFRLAVLSGIKCINIFECLNKFEFYYQGP